VTNYTQQIRINETRSALERTVMAAEDRIRRELATDQAAALDSAAWYRGLVDYASDEALIALSQHFGSLTGLVLAAEGISQ
jgi:hypothetical protein